MKKKQESWVWDCYTLKRELRIMKAIVVLLLVTFIQAHSATGFSQEKQVNLKLKKASILEVISEIENQSDYKFFFSPNSIDIDKVVSVDIQEKDMVTVLEEVFGKNGVVYRIIDNQVILTTPTNVTTLTSKQQTITVTGLVRDVNGDPLPGVNVFEKSNPTSGVITGIDGKYSIKVSSVETILSFSYIGFESQDVNVSSRNNIDITLVEEYTDLDEVVVVGYGTQKKVNLTGSVATIKGEQLESRPTNNVMKAIQGTVPGVTVVDRPGGTQLNIRGMGTFAGDADAVDSKSQPLYIVDGIEVSAGFFNLLDPATIESVNFLKDAASGAIYGAKAAYGVVLVETKSGEKGKAKVNYNGSFGSKKATVLPDVCDSWQYAEEYRKSQLNSGDTEDMMLFSLDDIQKYKDGSDLDLYPNSDWFDIVLKPSAFFTRHNLQISGGAEKINYLFSVGYQRDEELVPGRGTDKYNFLLKTSSDVNDWLRLDASVNFVNKKFHRTTGNVSYTEMLRAKPTLTNKQSNGEWGSVLHHQEASAEDIGRNQQRKLEEAGRGNSSNRELLTNFGAVISPIKGLTITNQVGYNYWTNESFSFNNKMDGVPSFINPSKDPMAGVGTNSMENRWYNSEKIIYDGWINYAKKIDAHNLSIMAGMHADDWRYNYLKVGRKNFGSDDMSSINGGSTVPEDQITTEGYVLEESALSYFGRFNYDFNGKYLFEVNFRADGSSRFSKIGKWGHYPSFSAGWRISEESFMQSATWLDNLKMRASWGKNGNIKSSGRYATYDLFSSSGTVVNGGEIVNTVTEAQIANPDLTWEETETVDIGLDMTIKNGLVNLTFDYFNRYTDNVLVNKTDVPYEAGLPNTPFVNMGQAKNNGIELAISHHKQIGDFSYDVGFNVAKINNEITDLGGVDQLAPENNYFINKVGYAIPSFWGLEADGMYSTEDIANGDVIPYGSQIPEAGMLKYVDQLTEDTDGDGIPDKGDGVINSDDRKIIGQVYPDLTYGININLNYKNWSLSALGQGTSGADVYLDLEASMAFFNGNALREWHLDNWSPENQGAVYPKLYKPSDERTVYNQNYSSFWLFDADYFRVKNITLSYDIPSIILDKVGLEKVKIYVSGDNLFTFSAEKRMKDFDPERSSGRGVQLNMKTYTAGLSVSF